MFFRKKAEQGKAASNQAKQKEDKTLKEKSRGHRKQELVAHSSGAGSVKHSGVTHRKH